MYEVEAKVRLTPSAKKRVLALLSGLIRKKPDMTVKKDFYYGDAAGFFMRLRVQDKRCCLNLKTKHRKAGIESNQELELPLKNGPAFTRWLKKWGIQETAEKEKRSLVYSYPPFTIELNHLKGLGEYLEIEIMVEDPQDVPAAQKKLQDFFKKLGFNSSQFEKRHYLELLREK